MDQILAFILAILPILVIFVGLVFLKKSGTLMGIVGWLLTVVLAVLFFNTSPEIAIEASIAGALASFGISLMVLFTILQVTMMDVTGAIKSITQFVKSIAAERYEQIMILNVGLGTFLVAIGATPVTMLPPIMIALGFSPVAAVALPCLGYDPLTSFSLLAVPITLPAQVFGFDVMPWALNISLFLPVVSTGLALGMLWVADGIQGLKKGMVPALVAGLTLGLSTIVFVRILPDVKLVGVSAGLCAIVMLLLLRIVQGKPILQKKEDRKKIAADGGAVMPLWKAVAPWAVLVVFCVFISIPVVTTILHDATNSINYINIAGGKPGDMKWLAQAYTWVLVSTVITAPLLLRTKVETVNVLKIWIKRAWSPTLAAMVFFAIAYVMDWSARGVSGNSLTAASDMNMNVVIGATLAAYLGVMAFPLVSPMLGLFGGFVSGSEASSNVMFHGILSKATNMLGLDFLQVYAAHAVAGGIASGIAVAKIVNAAAVIDKIGIEGEVIRKSAAVIFVLTIVVGLMLSAWIMLF